MIVSRVMKHFRAETAELNVDDEKLLSWLGINPDEVHFRGTKAMREATVFACVKILAESLGKLPVHVYRETDQGNERDKKHYLQTLLRTRPNPYMTASDMWRMVEAQRNLLGNGYISPEFYQSRRRRGQIRYLWPIESSAVSLWVDDLGILDSSKRIWYQVNVDGELRRLEPDEILHFKGISLDGLVGISPIDQLRYLVESGGHATQYVRDFFKQGLTAKGIVHYTGDLNEEAKKNFRERFESMASGLKNNHRVSLLPIGYQFQPLSLSMVDAQFLENTQLTIRQIATAFGVKMHQLNDLERSTHTNIEQQQKQFYADTLQAILTNYEQEMTYKLFLPSEIEQGYYVKFNVDSIVRSDIQARYNAYRTGIQGGFLKPNEARAKEDMPPVDGGDRILVNGSLRPLDEILSGGEGNQE